MNKIVSVIRPFTMQQNVFVYDGSNSIKISIAEMDNIEEAIINLAKEYNTNEVELIGAKKFTSGIKDKIIEQEINKYNENKLNIKLTNN